MRFVIENTKCPYKLTLYHNPKLRHSSFCEVLKMSEDGQNEMSQNYTYKVTRKSNEIHALLKNGVLGGPRPHLRTRRAIRK